MQSTAMQIANIVSVPFKYELIPHPIKERKNNMELILLVLFFIICHLGIKVDCKCIKNEEI